MNLYTSPCMVISKPTNMFVFPLVSNLDLIFFPLCMATTAISPNDLRCLMGFASLLKNNVYGDFVLSVLTMMLSNFVAVEITSHQNFLLSCWCYPACFIIDLALPIRVGIFLSATEFFWGVPGAVNSKITPRFCFSYSLWRLLFSPLLSNLIFFTSMPYLLINALIHIDIITNWSLFLFRKKLWLQSLNSSTAISQCLFPPMLSCWKELMSINIRYPGLLGTCFIFFFGMLACLIFVCAHISHGGSCPVLSSQSSYILTENDAQLTFQAPC